MNGKNKAFKLYYYRFAVITIYYLFCVVPIFAQDSLKVADDINYYAFKSRNNSTLSNNFELPPITVPQKNIFLPTQFYPTSNSTFLHSILYENNQYINDKTFEIPQLYGLNSELNSIIRPFGYNYDDAFQGVQMLGLNARLISTQNVELNFSLFMSNSYMGAFYSSREYNLGFSTEMLINVGEYIKIKLGGQYSVNQGINPMYSPMMGASNSYTAAIQVKITHKFGLELGATRSCFMGEWRTQYYIIPVFY